MIVNSIKSKGGKCLHSKCIECCRIANKKTQQTRDKEKKQAYNKLYYNINKETICLKRAESSREYARDYYRKNKELIFAKEKERYSKDVQFRLSKIYKNRLTSSIKGECKSVNYLGIGINQLQFFIESQFMENMSWENKGFLWELDHVIPISKFNLTLPLHRTVCFHWCNLKPISKKDNRRKSNKLIESAIKEHQIYCENVAKQQEWSYIDIYKFFLNNITY